MPKFEYDHVARQRAYHELCQISDPTLRRLNTDVFDAETAKAEDLVQLRKSAHTIQLCMESLIDAIDRRGTGFSPSQFGDLQDDQHINVYSAMAYTHDKILRRAKLLLAKYLKDGSEENS